MAPLDSNPDDHGHLLGDGIGRMPRGCAKTEDARNSQAAPALVLSGPSSSHILGYAPLEKQATSFCTSESPAHVLSHLRSFPSTRFQVQLTGTCFQCPGTLGDGCVIGRFGEPPFVLVLFRLRCLRCTGNGKCGQGIDLVDNSGSNCEHVCPGMQLAQSVEFSDDYGSPCLVEEDKRHHKVEDASSGQV